MDASYDKTCQSCCCARNQVGNSQEWVTSSTPHHSWKNHMLPPLESGNREIWEKDVKISLTKCTLFPGEEKVVVKCSKSFPRHKEFWGLHLLPRPLWLIGDVSAILDPKTQLVFGWWQAAGGKKPSYFRYSLCVHMEILSFFKHCKFQIHNL